ncbi:MAG: amino acid ABC transporter permease [Verrucomicrobiales bacterium]|nr:amino acid ABC transporter permease [Verrucomicrobiales bacterium]
MDPQPNPRSAAMRWARTYLVLLLGLGLILSAAFLQLQHHWNWSALWRYRALFVKGWLTTVALASAALVLSTGLGLGAALLARRSHGLLRAGVRLYVELIRGTPFLVQILILFYVVAQAAGVQSRVVVGTTALALFAGAYITEIIRSGIDSIAESQWETARALGLTTRQTYRWVVFPQAARQVLPPLTGQWVSLIKDSSLLSVIGLGEFALNAQQANAITYSTLESYLVLAAGYLLLTLPLSLLARHLERRARFAS